MAATNIVDVVKDFVSLRKSGANFKGLCPFHADNTPSFMVSPSKQMCKCFSCGAGGNAVKFLMMHESLTYPEAIKWLGNKYGIEVQDKELSEEAKIAAGNRESLFIVNTWARDFFVKNLTDTVEGNAIGMRYFRHRGIRADIIKKFQLGYSPESKDALANAARTAGYDVKYLLGSGLIYKTESTGKLQDRFHGRVIFPIHTISGRVVAFGGRTLLSKEAQKARSTGKYVNSPESDIYSKKKELYGLYQAKQAIAKAERVFLVEGYLDVISMHQSGIENVVASCGTALTEEQIRLIHRFTNNVTLLYDGDPAGIHAALRGVDMLLSQGLNIKVLLLPDGEDPDSFAQSHSSAELRQYIEDNQTDFIRFKTDLLLKNAKNDPTLRASVIKDVVSSIAVIPDKIVQQMYIHECAGRMGIDEMTIANEVIIGEKRYRDALREEKAKQAAQEKAAAERAALASKTDGTSTSSDSANAATASPQGQAAAATTTTAPSEEGADVPGPFPPDDLGLETFGTGQPTVSLAEQQRFSESTNAEKKLVAIERELMTVVVRFGGLPVLLKELEVKRKFGGGVQEQPEVKDETPTYEPEDGSPLVAPHVYDSLVDDDVQLQNPLYQRMLIEAANLADAGNFDALNYFRLHENPEVAQLAEQLTDERHLLSMSQSKMYVPDERRLKDIVPRLINDYKHAVLQLKKEKLLQQIRDPEVLADEAKVVEILQELEDTNELEKMFAKALGERVLN